VELSDAVIVVLEAAHRPLTIYEIARECDSYIEEPVSYFEVKQVCMKLYEQKSVRLEYVEPLTFRWVGPPY